MYVNSQDESVERQEVDVIIKKAVIKLTIDEDRISRNPTKLQVKSVPFVSSWSTRVSSMHRPSLST